MNLTCKQYESVIKNILYAYKSPIDGNKRLRFIIHYEHLKTLQLVVGNNRAL